MDLRFCPDERRGGFVVVGDKGVDVLDEFWNAREGLPVERFFGEDREPDFDLVEPGGVRRGVTTTFSPNGEKFMVRTEGPDGAPHDCGKPASLRPTMRAMPMSTIALNSIGAGASAMELLENTNKRHSTDRDTVLALVSISRDTGDFATALSHARELVALYPADMQLRMLVLDLEKRQAH